MKRYFISVILLLILALSSCNKNNDPVSDSDPQLSGTDGEGNYPTVNTACNDNVLFTSDRRIGTTYYPSVHGMNKDGSNIHSITNEWLTFGASWSPRRWKIIFVAHRYMGENRGLYIMNSDGTDKKRLTPLGEDAFGTPAWSPDGSKIAYIELDTADQYGRGRVKIINPDGTDAKILTDWFGQLSRVTWSPDSRKIVFGGFKYNSYDKLYIMNSDGTSLTELFDYSEGCNGPSWSPDGTLIAFTTTSSIDDIHYAKIFTFNINTHQINQVTSGKTFDSSPTWSSDSKTILFALRPAGPNANSSIYSIEKDGSNLVRLTDSLGYDYNVSWYK